MMGHNLIRFFPKGFEIYQDLPSKEAMLYADIDNTQPTSNLIAYICK